MNKLIAGIATAGVISIGLVAPASAATSGKVHPPRQWLSVVKCDHVKPGQTPPIKCRKPIPLPGPDGNL